MSEAEYRMVVGTGNFDRSEIAVWLILEKRIQHFQHQRFNPMSRLGNFGLGFQCSVKINFLVIKL